MQMFPLPSLSTLPPLPQFSPTSASAAATTPPPPFPHVSQPPWPPFLSQLLTLFSWLLSNPPLPLFCQRLHSSHLPGWLLHGFLLCHNLLTRHRLLALGLVIVSPLVALPSHLPWLVVASPLVTLPLPLNGPAATSWCIIASPCIGASNSLSPFVKNNPPAPSRLFLTLQRKKIKKYPIFFCCILCYVSDVIFFQSWVRFVLAHKINLWRGQRKIAIVLFFAVV